MSHIAVPVSRLAHPRAGSLFVLSASLALFCGPASAASWCVSPTATGNCKTTIGAAVAAASANDIISIGPGTYKETVKIGVALTLISGDPAKTIIDATGLANGIYVDGIDNSGLSNVFISGLTVKNANYEGILVANATAVTISGNILTGNNVGLNVKGGAPTCPNIPSFETGEGFDCGEGIHFTGVSNSSILNNTVQGNSGGILLSDDTGATHDNLIAGNTVTLNVLDCGITIASHPPADLTKSTTALGVYHNMVVGNVSSQNGTVGEGSGVGIFASAPGTAAYNNVVVNNTLVGNGIPGVAIHGHTPNQNLNGNVIIGNTLSGNGADDADTATPVPAGINVASVSPVTGTLISQNTISGEGMDVVVQSPGEARVERNTLAGPIGVANPGAGTVNADGNWWGCAGNPTFGYAAFGGCAVTSGGVTVNTWLSAPYGK